MDIRRILSELVTERERIDRAIAALQQLGDSSRTEAVKSVAASGSRGRRGRRSMSPAARKRMSAMMKKRWAERKKAAKKGKAAAA